MTASRVRVQTSPSLDLALFAIDATANVVVIGQTIIDSSGGNDKAAAPFCRNLCNVLRSIRTLLEQQRESNSATPKKAVTGLLNNLERLCNWPRSTSSGWPTLSALNIPSKRGTAARNLRSFGADDKRNAERADIIQRLKKFGAARFKAQTIETLTDSGERPLHQSHELDDDIDRLHKILLQHRFCDRSEATCNMRANIQLNSYRPLVASNAATGFIAESASAEFGVLFLDHPHAEDGQWQETRIQTCHTKSSNVPIVTFADEDSRSSTIDLMPSQDRHVPIPHDQFCKFISRRGQDLLYLSARDNKFVYHTNHDASRTWFTDQRAVSLASTLAKGKAGGVNLNGKSRAILGMLLAKATWQFFDSDIIGEGITSDHIHFLCEERDGKTGPFGDEPMLVTRFNNTENHRTNASDLDSRDVAPTGMIHRIPKVLALGILLLELETGKTMKEYRSNKSLSPPGPININTDYKIMSKLVSTKPNAHPESIIDDLESRSPLRKVLPLCVKSQELMAKKQENLIAQKIEISDATINEQNALRSVIYSEIVKPLEDRVEEFEDLSRVKPLFEVEVAPNTSRPLLPSVASSLPRQQTSIVRRDEKRLREDSRDWWHKFERLRDTLQPGGKIMENGYKRIRVAVLDTGITSDDYQYLESYNLQMKSPPALEYIDFVHMSQDSQRDDTGHGSEGISLMTKVCPNASLYIARVMKTNVATSADVARVVQGIDWAIDKDVDIISMAIGFKKEQPLVVEAIGRAHRHGILIFSAASNDRNQDPVYCPANETDKVFGVFSTDAGIRESRTLNPTPLDPNSFAIFGEQIELEENLPLLRGTSYSTSIMAGLAAALLDFVQQEPERPHAAALSKLKNRPQLTRVFQDMAEVDNDLFCIRPWKLLHHGLGADEHGGPEDMIQQREWIWSRLVQLMEKDRLHEIRRR